MRAVAHRTFPFFRINHRAHEKTVAKHGDHLPSSVSWSPAIPDRCVAAEIERVGLIEAGDLDEDEAHHDPVPAITKVRYSTPGGPSSLYVLESELCTRLLRPDLLPSPPRLV